MARPGRRVLVATAQLKPPGAAQPLAVDDYEWSPDRGKLLVYTNSQKVWRQRTRGDYWVLDVESGSLRKLGGDAKPATLMFATWSPDGTRVAYARRDLGATMMATNLFVEDVAGGRVTRLTGDARVRRFDGSGATVINGTGDWVYEEEFGLRKAFEWSPDGSRIAYWQFDATAVRCWSGGGSMTLHLMFRYPELYRMGMSVAPVSDQRLYDTIYQERYMGTPQGNLDGYRLGSPISYAEGLRGKLLLVCGTGDDNVHYQSCELLLDRLVAFGKPVDFMAYPMRTHALAERAGTVPHFYSLLTRYLTTNLPGGQR